MPDNWVLKQIAFPPPKWYFVPKIEANGRVLPPRISLPDQARIRLVCKLAGINAENVVGLPAESMESTNPSSLYPKSDRALEKLVRQKKIEENMAKMPARIAAWREEKRKTRASAKPDMPF
ncbi:hypothetical protein BASA60_001507 [Batrachochytrium salamandrivorans]|nr:hypothetical protein BASA60_001507 [Batrachochytrium salamandrivorans]